MIDTIKMSIGYKLTYKFESGAFRKAANNGGVNLFSLGNREIGEINFSAHVT